jgi:hypothetical protein
MCNAVQCTRGRRKFPPPPGVFCVFRPFSSPIRLVSLASLAHALKIPGDIGLFQGWDQSADTPREDTPYAVWDEHKLQCPFFKTIFQIFEKWL